MRLLVWLYALNASLLTAHEIDSAYWREWELFGMRGDIGGFVLMHVPLVLLVLWGFARLLAGGRAGLWMSVVLAAAGFSALAIHSALLAAGHPQFRTPVSIGVLVCAAAVSALQLAAAARGLRAAPTA